MSGARISSTPLYCLSPQAGIASVPKNILLHQIANASSAVSAVVRFAFLQRFVSLYPERVGWCCSASFITLIEGNYFFATEQQKMILLVGRYETKSTQSKTVQVMDRILTEGLEWPFTRMDGIAGKIFRVPADGNCFFYAIAFALHQKKLHTDCDLDALAMLLRTMAVDWLESNVPEAQEMKAVSDSHELHYYNSITKKTVVELIDFEQYCKEMRKSNVFAEGIIINAIAHIVKQRIEIHGNDETSGLYKTFVGDASVPDCLSLFLEAEHYRPVVLDAEDPMPSAIREVVSPLWSAARSMRPHTLGPLGVGPLI